jgi:uncharacterized protein (TIGR00255 family)
MKSMTGFGESEGASDRHRITATMRSVNHRFLDVVVRCRDEHRSREGQIKALVAEALTRGRVEISLEVESFLSRESRVMIQEHVVEALHAASTSLQEKGLLRSSLSFSDVLRVPAAVEVTTEPLRWDEEDDEALLRVCQEALVQLVEGREREGKELTTGLLSRLEMLENLVEELESNRGLVVAKLRETLMRRIEEVLTPPVEQDRYAQEVAFLVDRSDIQEELDRLQAHIRHFRHLTDDPEPAGKRLDFLSQEIARELNTIGAKCRDSAMSRVVVDAKAVTEQLREQIQNVE